MAHRVTLLDTARNSPDAYTARKAIEALEHLHALMPDQLATLKADYNHRFATPPPSAPTPAPTSTSTTPLLRPPKPQKPPLATQEPEPEPEWPDLSR